MSETAGSVEEAPSDLIFSRPRHPYTVGLLESVPQMGKFTKRLATIPGVVPSLLNLPSGCRFQNRCPRATEVCRQIEPKLEPIGPDHQSACYNPY